MHTQARARENNSINQKGRLSKPEEGTQTFIFVIEITLHLGGSIDVLLSYGQSFFSSKNGPG